MTALYVGNLCSDITEAILFDKFSAVGPLISIRLCTDFVTFQPLGYAYINFQYHADAKKALKNLNFDMMQGQSLRIMWSQRDASLRKSGIGNIIIKNLDKSFDNKSLYLTFEVLGNITSCKVMENGNGKDKIGFVQFETEEASINAIQTMNRTIHKGKQIFVGQFIAHVQREKDLISPNNVFVKNIFQMSEKCVRGIFCKFGIITSVKVVYKKGKQETGFGFVNFQSQESAEKAIKNLNGIDINGRALYVGRTEKKAEKQQKTIHKEEKLEQNSHYHVLIKNLDYSIDEVGLMKEFSIFGVIISAQIMYDSNKISKGFGFVSFCCPEDARHAISNMNGSVVAGKALYVAPAKIKEDRQIADYDQKASNHFVTASLPNKETRPMLSQFGPQNFCYKYTNHMRNPPKMNLDSAKVINKTGQQEFAVQKQELLSTKMLVNVNPSEQKQILGEKLFPLIYKINPDQANKLTGMILEIDNADIIHLLEDKNALEHIVEAAASVLNEH